MTRPFGSRRLRDGGKAEGDGALPDACSDWARLSIYPSICLSVSLFDLACLFDFTLDCQK